MKQIAAAKFKEQCLSILDHVAEEGLVITKHGQPVKVLDFGLAKAMDPSGASNPNVSHSPTLTHQGTSAGMIIGTAAYMSPEEAKGKAVDKTDAEIDAPRLLFAGLHGHDVTRPDSVISESRVKTFKRWTRAVETINRSAGSRWNESGKRATSDAMAAVIGRIRTVWACAANSSHSSKPRSNWTRVRLTRVATSHRLMALIMGRVPCGNESSRLIADRPRRGSAESHQIHAWVSSRGASATLLSQGLDVRRDHRWGQRVATPSCRPVT